MQNILQRIKEEFAKLKRSLSMLRFLQLTDATKIWKRMKKIERWSVALLFFIFIADFIFILGHWYTNHTKVVPEHGGVYTEGVVGEPSYINPLLAQTQTDKDLSRLAYSGLYKYDDQGNFVPDLAASQPIVSASQRQFTIKLKPGLTWQDGQKITADDIIFTIQTIQNPAYQSPFLKNWQNTIVKKIDDTTVEFDNPDISAPFVTNFTIGILPKHLWANIAPSDFTKNPLNLAPIGSGPFVAKEVSRDSSGGIKSYMFSSFKNYAGGRPYIDNLEIHFYPDQKSALLALHSKEIEGFGYTPFDQNEHFQPATNLSLNQISTYSYLAAFFNTNGSAKALGDFAVRTALTQATNRQEIITQDYSGNANPAYGPFAPQQLGYNPAVEKINSYDVDAANQTLDQAKWVKDASTGMRSKNGVQLAFTITTNNFLLNSQTAQTLKEQWAKIGANVSIKTLTTTDLATAISNRSYDALLFSENTGYDPDPFIFWQSSQSLNPGLNLSEYKNTSADKIMAAGRNTLDTNIRIQNYSKFQQTLLVDAPAVFLVRPIFTYAMRAEIKGLSINQLANPEDRFYDIVHWYVDTKRVWK